MTYFRDVYCRSCKTYNNLHWIIDYWFGELTQNFDANALLIQQ